MSYKYERLRLKSVRYADARVTFGVLQDSAIAVKTQPSEGKRGAKRVRKTRRETGRERAASRFPARRPVFPTRRGPFSQRGPVCRPCSPRVVIGVHRLIQLAGVQHPAVYVRKRPRQAGVPPSLERIARRSTVRTAHPETRAVRTSRAEATVRPLRSHVDCTQQQFKLLPPGKKLLQTHRRLRRRRGRAPRPCP